MESRYGQLLWVGCVSALCPQHLTGESTCWNSIFRHDGTDARMNSELTACARPAQVQSRHSPSTEERLAESHPWPRNYLQLVSAGKRKTHFLQECHWVYQPHSRASPVPKSSWLAQSELHGFFVQFFFGVFLSYCFGGRLFWFFRIFFMFLLISCFYFCFREKEKVWS